MAHVFTYGTLMYPEVWLAIAGRSFQTVEGRAAGFAIYRVRDAVFPGIRVAMASDSVRGVVYQDVDRDALMRLDQFEDTFYERRTLRIACDDGETRDAEAYVVPDANLNVLTDEPWGADEFVARGDLQQFIAGFAGFRRVASDDG